MSPGYDSYLRAVLGDQVGLRRLDKFKFWNVPGMGQELGKVTPFDVHGWHVLIDEREFAQPTKAATHGVLRYAVAAAGMRRKDGGRRLYDYTTMNFSLAVGGALGFAAQHYGRRRWNFMRKRPLFSIGLGLFVMAAMVPLIRSIFKVFSVGILIAEKQHERALRTVQCYDCLCDVHSFTEQQMSEVATAKLPPNRPGLPPHTPEMEKRFEDGMQLQLLLLSRDLTLIRQFIKNMLHANNVKAVIEASPEQQAVDAQRRVAEGSTPEAEAARQKAQADAARRERQIAAGIKPIDAPVVPALTKEEEEFQSRQLLQQRVVPSMLCELHRGLRSDPAGYRHPLEWPIFTRDRQVAQLRPELLSPTVVA
jgi:hypothetical protein